MDIKKNIVLFWYIILLLLGISLVCFVHSWLVLSFGHWNHYPYESIVLEFILFLSIIIQIACIVASLILIVIDRKLELSYRISVLLYCLGFIIGGILIKILEDLMDKNLMNKWFGL